MALNLGPNLSILKSPSNWFLVLFSLALLTVISHLIFTRKGSNNEEE